MTDVFARALHDWFHDEFDGHLGQPWLSRLFTPDEVREAVAGTRWTVAELREGEGTWEHTYTVTLAKE